MPQLRAGFEKHLKETESQVQRLEQVFKMLDAEAKGEKCPAIDGILKEGKELMGEIDDEDVMNVGLIAAAQAVEHYEITRYGALIAWASELGRGDCVPLLKASLAEEKATDQTLTALAERRVESAGQEEIRGGEAAKRPRAPRGARPRRQARARPRRPSAPRRRNRVAARDLWLTRSAHRRACRPCRPAPRISRAPQQRASGEQRLTASRRMSRRNPDPGNRVSLSRRTVHAGRTRIHGGRATSSGAGISRTAVPVL